MQIIIHMWTWSRNLIFSGSQLIEKGLRQIENCSEVIWIEILFAKRGHCILLTKEERDYLAFFFSSKKSFHKSVRQCETAYRCYENSVTSWSGCWTGLPAIQLFCWLKTFGTLWKRRTFFETCCYYQIQNEIIMIITTNMGP